MVNNSSGRGTSFRRPAFDSQDPDSPPARTRNSRETGKQGILYVSCVYIGRGARFRRNWVCGLS